MATHQRERRRLLDWQDLLYVAPALLMVCLFMFWPFLMTFRLSAFRWDLLSPMEFDGWRNFERIFRDPVFWRSAQNTLFLAFFGPLIQTALALVLAAIITGAGRFRVIYRTAIFAPAMLALVAVGMIWNLIYNPSFGLLNSGLTAIGLESLTRVWIGDPDTALPSVLAISLWRWTGFNVVIFMAGLQALPEDVYEAAKIDGAGPLRRFLSITIPLIAPFTFLNFLINVIGYIKLFDIVFVTTRGGPDNATSLLATYIYKHAFEFFNIGTAAAASVVLFCITAIVIVFFYIVSFRLDGSGREV
jgi:raffinose/stachyose/melibiose transport system permease protein